MNKVILIGNLTRDAELKNVSGSDLANGSLAISYKYKSGNETKEETTYVDFVIWGKRASTFAQYTSKGKKVALEGRLQSKSWEAPDGSKRSKLFVNVDSFEFLSPNNGSRTSTAKEPEYATDHTYGDDDIPF